MLCLQHVRMNADSSSFSGVPPTSATSPTEAESLSTSTAAASTKEASLLTSAVPASSEGESLSTISSTDFHWIMLDTHSDRIQVQVLASNLTSPHGNIKWNHCSCTFALPLVYQVHGAWVPTTQWVRQQHGDEWLFTHLLLLAPWFHEVFRRPLATTVR